MRKVVCYKCDGSGLCDVPTCRRVRCDARESTREDCLKCPQLVGFTEMVCYVCDGRGSVEWIDELFRRV